MYAFDFFFNDDPEEEGADDFWFEELVSKAFEPEDDGDIEGDEDFIRKSLIEWTQCLGTENIKNCFV